MPIYRGVPTGAPLFIPGDGHECPSYGNTSEIRRSGASIPSAQTQ